MEESPESVSGLSQSFQNLHLPCLSGTVSVCGMYNLGVPITLTTVPDAMGKSRRSRTKRHLSAVRPDETDDKVQSCPPLPEEFLSKAPIVLIDSRANNDDQERGAGLISKKRRQKIRHENWLRSIVLSTEQTTTLFF